MFANCCSCEECVEFIMHIHAPSWNNTGLGWVPLYTCSTGVHQTARTQVTTCRQHCISMNNLHEKDTTAVRSCCDSQTSLILLFCKMYYIRLNKYKIGYIVSYSFQGNHKTCTQNVDNMSLSKWEVRSSPHRLLHNLASFCSQRSRSLRFKALLHWHHFSGVAASGRLMGIKCPVTLPGCKLQSKYFIQFKV